MDKYCVDLNWDMPVLAPGVTFDFYKQKHHQRCSITHINPDVLLYLSSKKTRIQWFESFYSRPNFLQPIHADCDGGDYIKLNWVYGGTGSLMHWYTVNEGQYNEPGDRTPLGTPFVGYNSNQVQLEYSAMVGTPSIVQVGVPHNIANGPEERLCLSLVLVDYNNQRLTMQDAIERFRN